VLVKHFRRAGLLVETRLFMRHPDGNWAGRTLGLEVAQLNHELLYPQTGRTANQLLTLDEILLLTPRLGAAPEELPALPDPFGSAPLHERARAYLHTNCAGCHRAGVPASAGMDWRYDVPLGETDSCDVPGTTSGDLGVGNARIIAPGDRNRSLAWLRMGRRDAHAMPPVGSLQVDADGLVLIGAWIDGLAGCED
jgi:hypothetical protein